MLNGDRVCIFTYIYIYKSIIECKSVNGCFAIKVDVQGSFLYLKTNHISPNVVLIF